VTDFNWKKKSDGMLPPDMRRLKQLEDENAKLRKLVADLPLDKEMLQDVIRRACRVQEMDTSTCHYKCRREQAGIEARIREFCVKRVRYGYRRVHVLLRREGWEINVKRTHRIYNELGLQLRNKTPKRRVKAKLREDRCAAPRVNDVLVMDFVHDQLANRPTTPTSKRSMGGSGRSA
jgi:hypothetical protein